MNSRIEIRRFVGFLVIAVASVFFSCTAQAQFSTVRRALKHHVADGHIRVFYDTEGPHAVRDVDANENNVPDIVEDVLNQTWCAHHIFVGALGFPDPIKSERYKEATYLDINILAKSTLKLQGVAYDELQSFKREIDPAGTRAICFDIASSITPQGNPTPTHEYFHLIQYSQTYFKPRWYLEGMARWSEHAVWKDGVDEIKYKRPWPHSKEKLEELFAMTYSTQYHIWNPLAKFTDRNGRIPSCDATKLARQLRYANGKTILKDFKLNGAEFMKDVLVRLGEYDDIAKKDLGFKKWAEKNQKSEKNNPYIYKAVMDVAREHGVKVGEYWLPGGPRPEDLAKASSEKEKEPAFRTWKTKDGKHSINAKLVEVKNDEAVLLKENKATISVPLKKLSKTDRDYLQNQVEK